MYYRRLTEGLNDKGTLISEDKNAFDVIRTQEKDWYLSTFKYNEQQKSLFQDTGTVAGINDVITDKLWWDFDSEFEPEAAKKETLTLVDRLLNKGIEKQDIAITFSGNKGFGVELYVDQTLSPKEVKSTAFELAKELSSFDVKMYNAARILRITATKHPKTGLYKTPLTYVQLKELSVDSIMKLAKTLPEESNAEFRYNTIQLSKVVNLKQKQTITSEKEDLLPELSSYIDNTSKPKFLTNCRWAIQNGFFKAGERSTALLCLASTYKNVGFDQEIVYRMLKGVAELQARRHNCDRYSDEEVYNNILLQVFGPNWNNGQYTCREENNWLHTFCAQLDHPCNHKTEDDLKPKHFVDIKDSFKDYVTHIEENIVKTGLPSIDNSVFISTGANAMIIGAPGSGKTSLALNMLNNTSKAGVKSVFASLDMHRNRMFEKVMYKISGKPREELYDLFKKDKEGPLLDKLKQEFGNVFFFNKSCPSVEDVRNYVIACQEASGEKIRFVMLDYFERISSELGDDTAASKRVAGELQDMVNDLDVALVTLVQPNKNGIAGGPDQPIYDYTKIKGSSFVYQSARIILSMWRPFYSPQTFTNDKYMQMAVLKNDLGELTEFAFNWEGKTGNISEMEDFQKQEFQEILKTKMDKKTESNGFNGF